MASSHTALSGTAAEFFDGHPPPYCRAVLRFFDGRSTGTATVEDLAAFISEETERSGTERQVAIRLHHATLPKLADEGILDYDPGLNTARYRGAESDDRTDTE